TQLTGILTAIGAIGAICGGLYFGAWSQRIGRRRGIVIAALLTLPMILPWAFASSAAIIALGAFAVQFMVQGAWGIVPVHLNELSPDDLRATLPGLTYQLGNLISSGTPTLLAAVAASHGGKYGLTMGVFIAGIALAVALIAWFGPEAKDKHFG
ncbi:MAG: MFS transporter, partial [Rudaea sp.]